MKKDYNRDKKKIRRTLGVHLTSQEVFRSYIFPEIKDELYDYLWIDLYCGEGNLILPILDSIAKAERVDFFRNHIFLSDIQEKMISRTIEKTKSYGIPFELAKKKILLRDNLESFPNNLKDKSFPICHITNPPYLYLGYIRKHDETKRHLKYFGNDNDGYQDLYQIAMINDLRNNVEQMVYIIPSNFIFGASVSNKFRLDLLKWYQIQKMYIFETQMFEFTGTNICIGFFKRKVTQRAEEQIFETIKFKKKNKVLKRTYNLSPNFKYRGGSEFDAFLKKCRAVEPLKVVYYLKNDDVIKNAGTNKLEVIDTNEYHSNSYERKTLLVNDFLYDKVRSNKLYVRTVDTGSIDGRVGLNVIKDDFNVDGIYVSKATYRTSPIQIFLNPKMSHNDQILLMKYFNLILEYFRKKLDSEFLTTYKYSNAEYTRKYLGLIQVRKLIKTFPMLHINQDDKKRLIKYIENEQSSELINLLNYLNRKSKENL
ncbi:MAG: N-6 DNA methylase [Candidatus Lokiarchaeota archaeon]|nr:N-6 DNA methylase [Candidatus Lokiarchaeota archaeon]MBD3211248.1 N-6 DNA methylase [Candidatus Lokiarchaeota archaeon]